MIVRLAVASDVDSVLSLIRQTPTLPQWNRNALAVGSPLESETGTSLVRCLLVAENSNHLVGFAQFNVVLQEAELESMAVAAEHRRQGIGDALLRAVEAKAQALGASELRLELRAENRAALSLYQRAGLRVVGKRTAYYRDPVEDALLMQQVWNWNPAANPAASGIIGD